MAVEDEVGPVRADRRASREEPRKAQIVSGSPTSVSGIGA